MMQHLNYCRQAIASLRRDFPDERRGSIARMLVASSKFLLPEGGFLLEDRDLRGLSDSPVKLPFPVVALEWFTPQGFVPPWGIPARSSSRHVLLCRQVDEDIVCTSIVEINKVWYEWGDVMLHTDGGFTTGEGGMKVLASASIDGEEFSSAQFEAAPLLGLLNALACSNVKTERSEAKRTHKAMRKYGALPFDDYHVLTISVAGRAQRDGVAEGSHRSPREHLRRGHIRRLQDGRKLWVNATVVNPGVGGKVTKDYRLEAAPA